MRVAVCLYRQTAYYLIVNPYTHPDQQPIAYLRGQHPMTASEPQASGEPTSVVIMTCDKVCRVDEGRAAARRRGKQGKQRGNSKVNRWKGPSGSGATKQNKERKKFITGDVH